MSSPPKSTGKQKRGASFDPQVFLTTVGVARTITQCPKDFKIFSQGDPADSVFYIQQGRVKLKVKSKQGKEAVIAILGGGEFLGEPCLIGQTVCLATAVTIVPSTILRIDKKEMQRVLHEELARGNTCVRHSNSTPSYERANWLLFSADGFLNGRCGSPRAYTADRFAALPYELSRNAGSISRLYRC